MDVGVSNVSKHRVTEEGGLHQDSENCHGWCEPLVTFQITEREMNLIKTWVQVASKLLNNFKQPNGLFTIAM